MPHLRFAWLLSLVTGAVALSTVGTASAQDPAGAEILFQEGRRLLAAGEVDPACDKLKESYGLDPMSGTLLNLADCYVKQGKTATGWARFRNAAELAKSQGKADQAAEASRRASEVEPDLSYLTVEVTAPVPGLTVKRGEIMLSPSLYGTSVPVDPGPQVVVASAPGYQSVRLTAEIGAKQDRKTLVIPRLAAAKDTEALSAPSSGSGEGRAPSSAPTIPDSGRTGRYGPVPWIIGGAGVAALATGVGFGLLALDSNREAEDLCPTRQGCSSAALDAASRRDVHVTVANVGIGVGVVGLGVATWLLLSGGERRAARADRSGLTLTATTGPNEVVVWTQGRF
jgi:hypothetical protein